MNRAVVRALRGLVPAIGVLLLLACGGEYPQSSVDPKTDFAQSIHSLYLLVFWITLVILVLVWGVMAYILVRFRARPDTPLPRQTHGHLGLELLWTLIPTLIVMVIAIPTVRTVFATQGPVEDGGLVVDVIGHQFWWEFRYPNGVVTANELHLPVGTPVSLRLRSADVIHSFWIPMLGGKRDVNPAVAEPAVSEDAEGPPGGPTGDAQSDAEPGAGDTGAYNWLHFTINEAGVYRGQCAEFCGASHSLMGVRVVAESQAEFEAWMADWQGPAPAPPPDSAAVAAGGPDEERAEQALADSIAGGLFDSTQVAGAGALGEGGAARVELGRQTFHSSTCVACHAIEGTTAAGQLGPNLSLFGRRSTLVGWLESNPENIARWITAPQSIKPGAMMPGVTEMGGNFPATNLSEEQVRAVSEYLYSLGRIDASAGAAGAP